MIVLVCSSGCLSYLFVYMASLVIAIHRLSVFCPRDLLLLEAGFLAVIVAPLNFFGLHDIVDHHAHDRITLWLVKWLLFRLTFASGVVKLLSNSTTWWSLTGRLMTHKLLLDLVVLRICVAPVSDEKH